MFTLKGQYNTATILTDNCESEAQSQICAFLNHMGFAGSNIAVMPDVHAGKGSVIGFTCTLKDYVIPNIVGVDIGCGVEAFKIPAKSVDFTALDKFLRNEIPLGMDVCAKRSKYLHANCYKPIENVCKVIGLSEDRVIKSIGSLGSGNHFMEVDLAPDGSLWFVVHTGSRNFGKMVCEYHQKKAKDYVQTTTGTNMKFKDLEYLPLTGTDKNLGEEYLDHMRVAQNLAMFNRHEIMSRVVEFLTGDYKLVHKLEHITSVHNFIDFINPGGETPPIVRKGAISAQDGERVLIPMNMQFGTIVARGKGIAEYNYSAPHGAGRLMSRGHAKRTLSVDKYKEDMKDVFSTSVNKSTLDEAPDAYKNPQDIIKDIEPIVDIECVMKSVYNIKDSKPDKTGEHA